MGVRTGKWWKTGQTGRRLWSSWSELLIHKWEITHNTPLQLVILFMPGSQNNFQFKVLNKSGIFSIFKERRYTIYFERAENEINKQLKIPHLTCFYSETWHDLFIYEIWLVAYWEKLP